MFVSDRALFIQLDIFKLLLVAITPSLIMFLIFFIFGVINKLSNEDNNAKIVVSATLTALYNFIWAFFIFRDNANVNEYIHFSSVLVCVIFVFILIKFVGDKERRS